jgi:hypothetical protein
MAKPRTPATRVARSSFTLTPEDARAVRVLSDEMSDRVGRRVSGSAVMRGLLHLAAQDARLMSALAEAINTEVDSGLRWGMRKP